MKWLRLALILVALVALVSFSVVACDDDDDNNDDDNNNDDNDDATDDDLTDDDVLDDDFTDDDVTDDDDNNDDDDDNDDDLSPPAVGIGEPNLHVLPELFGANESFGYHRGVGGWSASESWAVGWGYIEKESDMWGAANDNVYLVSSFLYYENPAHEQYFWPVIMRFDGSNWDVDKIPLFWSLGGHFAAVHGNQDHVYAVGFSGLPEYYFIYKKDGGDWVMDHTRVSQNTPHDVWVADDGVVIIVAANHIIESEPIIIEKRNARWVQKRVNVPGRCVLYGVWGTDSQNVWLAGSCGADSVDERPLLVFYDGDVFTETTVPDSEEMGWRQITGHDDGTMYLASWGTRPAYHGFNYVQVAVLFYDGDVWRNTNIPTEDEDEEITSMWLSEESGLYVTKHEELWRYYNEEWQKLPSPELMQIWGVDHSSP